MFKTLSTFHIIIYLLLGLVMSSFATGMFDLLNLPPFYELVYLPLLYFVRKDFKFVRPIGRQFMSLLFVWLFLLLLAIILGNFSVGGILSVARSYLLILLFAFIAFNIKMDKKFYAILFLVSMGSIIGWALYIQGKLTGFFPWGEKDTLFAFYGNMLSIPLGISLVFSFFPNIFLIVAILVANLYVSFTSGLRRQMLVSLSSFAIYYLFYLFRNAAFKTLIPVIMIIAGVVIAFPIIEEKVADYSPYLYQRVFVRSVETGNIDSDDVRKEHFSQMLDQADQLILPHGFVSKRTQVDKGTGVFVDTPVYELFYTFGIPAVIFFFIFLIYRVIKMFICYIKHGTPPLSVWFINGFVFLMLLFVEGTMLSWTYTVPFTGLILGSIIRYGNSRRFDEINYYKQ